MSVMRTAAPRQYRASAIPQAAPKKLSAKEIRYRQECKEQVERLMGDPELYYSFHNNYEAMLYLVQMLTKVTLEMRGVAHVVFNDKNAAYKDLVKASNAYIASLKACNKAAETIRTDSMLFPNPDTDEGEAQYEASFRDSMSMLKIMRLVLDIMAADHTGLTRIESQLKLMYLPKLERQNRLVVAQGVLGKHVNEFPLDVAEKWKEYIYAQTEEGAAAKHSKAKVSKEQKDWAEYLSDNEKRG